ncbi:unnamed protein product [Ectocarpus sp. 12 AP-2014]
MSFKVDFFALLAGVAAPTHGTTEMTQVGPSRMASSLSWQSVSQLQQASGPAEAADAGKHHRLEVAAPRRRDLGRDARGTSLLLDTAEARSADSEHGSLTLDESNTDLRRRRLEANRPQADGSADADDAEGIFSPAVTAAEGWGLVNLRGQCSDGDSFTVTSPSIPSTEGCYTSVPGTSFGEGFLYSTEDSTVTTTIYPKVVTKDGTSNFFWAVSELAVFSGDGVTIDCLSVETTSTNIHPAAASWQCDVDGSGQLLPVEDDEFFLVCGCGTSATSGSSSGGADPVQTPTASPVSNPSSVDGDGDDIQDFSFAPTVSPTSMAAVVAPTPAGSSPPDTNTEVSGGNSRVAGGYATQMMTATAAGVVSLSTCVCVAIVSGYGVSLL